MNQRVEADYRLAGHVRQMVADVYGAASSAVVLAPGTLAGLRLVFASLGIERIALSAGEYFDAQSFPDTAVDALDADDVLESVVRRRPNAVLLSQVTWKGERLPLEPIFRHIRRRLGGGRGRRCWWRTTRTQGRRASRRWPSPERTSWWET